MGRVVMHPKAKDPTSIFPGIAPVDRGGALLAFDMLLELEDRETKDKDGILAGDRACLENWAREGESFRNVVLEYLKRSEDAGPATEAGFCAVISDFIATCSTSAPFSADRYEEMFNFQEESA